MFLEESVSLSSLASLGVVRASTPLSSSPRLKSLHQRLDGLLNGGLPFGAVSEWGLPYGRGGRELVLTYIVNATNGIGLENPLLCLWVYSPSSKLKVYPPAWCARGVCLERIRFAGSTKPVAQLKPLLLKPLFKVLVLDAPEYFTTDDLAFVARQARANRMAVLVLRNYALTPERGNVWAKIRLNCWQDELALNRFCLKTVRGLAANHCVVELPDEEEALL